MEVKFRVTEKGAHVWPTEVVIEISGDKQLVEAIKQLIEDHIGDEYEIV